MREHTRSAALRYLSCLRPQDVLVLQGPPLLGAMFGGFHPVEDAAALLTLLCANVLLMTHIFLLNDWSGLSADAADPNKASRVFVVHGVGRAELGAMTAGVLVLSLTLFARLGGRAFGLAAAIAVLSALYSLPRLNWKARPIVNSGTHLAGGVLHFLLGYCLTRAVDVRGVSIAVFFALIFAAGHLTQEVRDHDGDALNGILTNAVLFGAHRTFAFSLILFASAHIVLIVLSGRGVLRPALGFIAALFLVQLWWSFRTLREGLTYANVSSLQTRYRVLYAIVGIMMVVSLYSAP